MTAELNLENTDGMMQVWIERMGEEFKEVEKEELTVFRWLIGTTMFGTVAGDDGGEMEGEGTGAVGVLAA